MLTEKLCSSMMLKKKIAESRDHLYRVALAWCGNEMLADDLTQETVETGLAKHHQLRDREQLRAWLFRILHNNWYRHLRSNRAHNELDERMPSPETGPCEDCETLEVVNKVRGAVNSLSVEQRQVISLVDLEGFAYCDVANVLDIPIGTVMSRLHRARKNLSAELQKPTVPASDKGQRLHIVR